jgi:putative ABC transport system permease protein
VRLLLGFEGALVVLAGSIPGVLGGLLYARAMIAGLATLWRPAVGAAAPPFHSSLSTLCLGAGAGWAVAVLTLALALRKAAKQPIRNLLSEGGAIAFKPSLIKKGSRTMLWVALLSGGLAAGLIGWAWATGEHANAGLFFGAGALLLIAELALAAFGIKRLNRPPHSGRLSLIGLGARQCARRPSRSVAVLALLASGSFVLVAVSAFHLDAESSTARCDSGTGGFAWLGETALPVVQDLNTPAGLESFGLAPRELSGLQVASLRVHDGDDASCLNLNHPQKPRLLGVNPEALAGRFSFADAAKGLDSRKGWELLSTAGAKEDAAIPAIADASSLEWALGKKPGDTLDYTDERGRTFQLRLVGALDNSILQGSLLIDEGAFLKKFPSESGWRMFLLDAPESSRAQTSAALSRALQDVGLELTPAARRLETLNAVQNTYLGAFQVLGGLGLLLGSAGLGVVVLRNVLERRSELAVLLAVGFTRRALLGLVLREHALLLAAGLGIGLSAALLAVLPALLGSAAPLPWVLLGLLLGGVLLNGFVWTWLAARWALRGNVLAALRNE